MKKSTTALAFLTLLFFTRNAFSDISIREESLELRQREFQDIKGIRIGDSARLKAMLSEEGQYESNIFLTSNNKKHDYISITSPKFLLDVPMGTEARHLFQLMYAADIGSFANFKSQNYVNQNVLASANGELPFGYFDIQDDFKDTVDRSFTEFTERVRRDENFAQAVLGVEANRLTYEIGYSNFLRKYLDEQFDDLSYSENFLSATVFYQLFPKTKTLLEYDYGFLDYLNDSTRDGDYNQIRTGFKYDLTGKTTGIVKLGYQQRSYDTQGPSGFNGFVSEAELTTHLSENTTIDLKHLNIAVESIDASNNYFHLISTMLNVTQKIRGHFSILSTSRFDRRNYPEQDVSLGKKRRDSVVSQEISLQYDIKERAQINLGYQYTDDMSNIDVNDYNDHLISLRFNFLL